MTLLAANDFTELQADLKAARASHLERVRAHLAGRDADEVRTLINYFDSGDSRAAAAMLSDTELALLQHEIGELTAIDAALARIDRGVGGLCVVCHGPLPLARLRALPAAATCIACQDRIEAIGHPHR